MDINTVKSYTTYLPKSKVTIGVECNAIALVEMAMAEAGIKYNSLTDKKDRTDGDVLVVTTNTAKDGSVVLSYEITNLVKQQYDWDSGLQRELAKCAKYHKCTVERLTEELTELVTYGYIDEVGGRPA
jgi:hypothetical protein